MTAMWRFGRHLGTTVSALVDGQLDAEAAEEAWAHVAHCPACGRLVEREGWVKRRVALMTTRATPPEPRPSLRLSAEAMEAWAAVHDIEERGRGRRRAAVALVGAGSVSVAVLGLSTLSATPLGIGTAPSGPSGSPATSLSRAVATSVPTRAVVAPRTHVRGRLPGWTAARTGSGAAWAVPVDGPG